MTNVLLVSLGAALGALARFALSAHLNGLARFLPLGTLAANWLGCFLAGFLAAFLLAYPGLEKWRPFLMTGFLGALTTFSTFSLEVTGFLQAGRFGQAFLVGLLHVAGSLFLTLLGFAAFGLMQGVLTSE